MFEGLKKKFSDLVGSIVKKEETKAEQAEKTETVEKEIEVIPESKIAEKEQEMEEGPKAPIQKPQEANEERKSILNEKPKLSVISKIKSVITGKITIKEQDVNELLENFKLSLVEADVNYEVAERLVGVIKIKLVGATVESREITKHINSVVRDSLYEILDKGSSANLVKMAIEKKDSGNAPFRILFIGPNGAGKTTTMAKIASLVLSNGLTCVMSASDTFRAAAIEQTVHHAEKLGIKAIKGTYGADPSSVAFDSIEYAKAHRIDVVLIDSAGRQDTNKSLMDEMRKMVRVAAPDMKIFIGEGITGSAIIDQVREFNNAIKLDGIILTKLDCDAKGGNTISILGSSPVPILYFGLGEKYTDLMQYSPDFIIRNIITT